MNGTLSFWFLPPQTLIIEGGEYHNSSEELFTLAKHCGMVSTFDFGFKISTNRDVFYFLDSRISVRL